MEEHNGNEAPLERAHESDGAPLEPPESEAAPPEPPAAPDSERSETKDAEPTEEQASGAPEPVAEHPLARSKQHHVAPALISLERIDEDFTFRLRDEGELSLLATDIARLGQLFPIELRLRPPDRFQVVCGFRRIAALRFLKRDTVLARLHTALSDEDAMLMALAAAIHGQGVQREELEAVRDRLESEGRLDPAAKDMLEKALAQDDMLAPETVEEEIDADELAADVTARLGEINQDLSLLADVYDSLDDERKAELIKQLKYSADLVAFLESR